MRAQKASGSSGSNGWLLYVATLAPDEGETVAQVFYKDDPHELAPKLAPDTSGFIWMPDEGFANAFAHHATAEQIALARAVQRPISVNCIQEPAPKPLWTSRPSWFLIAEEDRLIHPRTQHFMAERMRATVELADVDHTPILMAPDEVVQFHSCGSEDLVSQGLSSRNFARIQRSLPGGVW